ncbi:MAG: PDZ domain-containing protein [Clostridia bacterium]|nr:PDZ domain-containing protein [Clostridia bacterium]
MKNRIKKLSVLFLLFCLLLSSLSLGVFATETGDFGEEVIEAAIYAGFSSAALRMQEEVDGWRASGEILEDSLGNPVDMDELISVYETNIAILEGGTLSFDAGKLATTNLLYYSYYIDDFTQMKDAAAELCYIFGTSYYLDRLDEEELVNAALIRSYQQVIGDRFGYYYTEEDLASQDASVNYVGIGVSVLLTDDGYAEVVQVFQNSSAEEAGMLGGDIIVAVNGEDFAKIGYNDAIDLIRGEEGTTVTVSVRRGTDILHFTMERRQTTSYSVTYEVLESENGKIGFVRISSFNETTFPQFCDAVEALEAEGVLSYIFDVRSNPGGMLQSVLGILDYILPDNTGLPLVRLQYKDGDTVSYYSVEDYVKGAYQNDFAKAKNHSLNKPIAVLCNSGSASASELFVSCLRDFEYAQIIGENTYGKGVGQSGLNFKTGGQLLLTTFYYAPPLSENYHDVGIVPDKLVSLSDEAKSVNLFLLSYELDAQLQAAVSYIESIDLSEPPAPPVTSPDTDKGDLEAILLWVLLGVLALLLALTLVLLFVFIRKGKRSNEDTLFSSQKRSDGSDMFHS